MRLGLGGLLVALLATSALAQTAPYGVNPDRLDQKRPALGRRGAPVKGPEAPKQAREISPFLLTAVRLDGSTAAPGVIDAAVRPFVGKSLDRAGLQQLTDVIAKAYGDHTDIALYTIVTPVQDFAGGVLRLRVLEGYLQQVSIGGHGKTELVRAYARRLTSERPLRRSSLQRYISLIRDIPGWSGNLQLVAGDQPGAVRLVIDQAAHPLQAGVSINNRGTALLGRTQVQGDLYLDSLLRQGDQTHLSVAVPTETRLFQFYTMSHSQPVGDDGATVTVNAGYLRTRPKDTGLAGSAKSLGLQAAYPLRLDYAHSLYLTLDLDGLNADNALFGETFSSDHTRAIRGGVSYATSSGAAQLSAAATTSFGIDALGARVTNPGLTDPSFKKLNLKAAYARRLTSLLVLRLDGTVQVSRGRLPASEQLALGGDEFGRGYEASIVAGDYGYAGSAELAVRPSKPPRILSNAEAYLFADDGKVWARGRLGGDTQSFQIASTGGGVRFGVTRHAVVELEAARALTDPTPYLEREGWRGVISVRTSF